MQKFGSVYQKWKSGVWRGRRPNEGWWGAGAREFVGGDGSLKCSSLPSVVAYVKGIMAKSKNIAFDSAIC